MFFLRLLQLLLVLFAFLALVVEVCLVFSSASQCPPSDTVGHALPETSLNQ